MASAKESLLARQREFTRHLVNGFPALGLAGMPLKSACAITGNASVENHVKPVTLGRKDHGSDGSLQWRLDRLDGPRGLKQWSARNGLKWDTLRAQAAFTIWEMENGESQGDTRYRGLLRDLREGRKSIETLTANFCKIYERPNMRVAHLDLRIRHARSVFMIMSRETPKPDNSTDIITGGAVVAGTAGAAANNATGGTDLNSLLIFAAIAGIGYMLRSYVRKPQAPLIDFDEIDDSDDDVIDAEPLQIEASETAEFEAAKQAVEDTLLAHQKAVAAFDAVRDRMQAEADDLIARIRGAAPRKAPSKAIVKTGDES